MRLDITHGALRPSAVLFSSLSRKIGDSCCEHGLVFVAGDVLGDLGAGAFGVAHFAEVMPSLRNMPHAECGVVSCLDGEWIENMVIHMKTTIEIAEPLLVRAKACARKRRITLRSLIEESLAAALDQPQPSERVQPVTFKGKGLSTEFEGGSWDQIRDAIYP